MRTFTCVCLPDKDSSKKIKKIMENVSRKCGSKRALKFAVHFTLRSEFRVEDKDITPLLNELKGLCLKTPKITIELTKYGFYPWRLIYLGIDVTPELRELHNKTMDTIEKYRTPWIREIYRKENNFKGKQKEYSLKYGYHFAYEFYHPHFTVAGNDMEEEIFQEVKKELQRQEEDINVTVKYLALMDADNGFKVADKIALNN